MSEKLNEFKKIDDERILYRYQIEIVRDYLFKNGAWK